MTDMTETYLVPPTPVPDPLTEAYWRGACDGHLVIQRCSHCSIYQHPPTSRCFLCSSEELDFEAVSGMGRIHSFTITHDARTPAFMARQPYAVVWIELEEQTELYVIANMPETPIDEVQIGRRAEVYFDNIANSVWLPQFRLAGPVEG